MAKAQEWSWVRVTKTFRGGQHEYQIRLPKGVQLKRGEWDSLLEWIGENTSGGHNYGYQLKTRRLRQKSDSLKVLQFPAGICESLMDYGEEVIQLRRMI